MDEDEKQTRIRNSIITITMTDEEAELLDLSMRNSFEVLINGLDAGEVIIQDFGYFAHDPSRVPTKTEVMSMIDYFISTEEYERCIPLKELAETLT